MNNQMINFFEELRLKKLSNKEIEKNINNNSQFTMRQYNEYLNLVEGVKMSERARLKEFLLSNSSIKVRESSSLYRIQTMSYFIIAASLLFILFIGYSFVQFNNSVYDTYSINEFSGNELGGIEIPINLFDQEVAYKKAVNLKKEEKFVEALIIFQSIEKENLNIQSSYHIAMILIKQKKYKEAKRELKMLIEKNEQHYLSEKAQEILFILNQPKINFFLFR